MLLTTKNIKECARYINRHDRRVFIGSQLLNIVSVRELEDGPVSLFLLKFVETTEPATLPDSEFGLED